jgi:hypothetical protein
MVKVIGPRDPRDPKAINTTSRSDNWSRGLSPFLLGPVKLYGDYVAQNVENAWQFSKVYAEHVGSDGKPSPAYFEWAKQGWMDTKAHRYPMGKGVKPSFSYWDGQQLTYVEARKKIYIPTYSAAVRESQAFKQLRSLYSVMEDIVLWDFDGYDHRSLGMTYEDVVNSNDRKCGHGFVLAMMLEQFDLKFK